MAELIELLGDRRGNFRMAMAGRTNRDAGAEVDITLAFHVPELGTGGALDVNRCNITLATRHGIFLAGLPVLVGKPGDFGYF